MSSDEVAEGQEYYEIEINGRLVKKPIKHLMNGNQVKIKKEVLTFAPWSNGENNTCFDKAMTTISRLKVDDDLLRTKFNNILGEWQLSYSLSHGSGLKGMKNVDMIRNELVKTSNEDYTVFDINKMKTAFDEYVLKQRGDVKKKVGTQSTGA